MRKHTLIALSLVALVGACAMPEPMPNPKAFSDGGQKYDKPVVVTGPDASLDSTPPVRPDGPRDMRPQPWGETSGADHMKPDSMRPDAGLRPDGLRTDSWGLDGLQQKQDGQAKLDGP